jgi:broad specificity phosphatase PhoE
MLDTQLNAMGKQQAELVGQRLSSEQFDVIYCSDLSRCKQVSSVIIIAYTAIPKGC